MKREDPMIRQLKQLAARVSRLLGGGSGFPPLFPDGGPSDPYIGVREPRRRGPGGRESAIGVVEPRPDRSVEAIGRLK
jgi:hypothetical protein